MNFKHIYIYLVLSGTFIVQFIRNINNEHVQDCSWPGASLAFCSHGKKLSRQGRLLGVVQWVTGLSKLPQGNKKLMWTVTVFKTIYRGKGNPGVSELPWGNELPRDHFHLCHAKRPIAIVGGGGWAMAILKLMWARLASWPPTIVCAQVLFEMVENIFIDNEASVPLTWIATYCRVKIHFTITAILHFQASWRD